MHPLHRDWAMIGPFPGFPYWHLPLYWLNGPRNLKTDCACGVQQQLPSRSDVPAGSKMQHLPAPSSLGSGQGSGRYPRRTL